MPSPARDSLVTDLLSAHCWQAVDEEDELTDCDDNDDDDDEADGRGTAEPVSKTSKVRRATEPRPRPLARAVCSRSPAVHLWL